MILHLENFGNKGSNISLFCLVVLFRSFVVSFSIFVTVTVAGLRLIVIGHLAYRVSATILFAERSILIQNKF